MSDIVRDIKPDDKDYFRVGNLILQIPPQNIEVARHENYQVVSYLRDAHSMRVNTGRGSIRVDISFTLFTDKHLELLGKLVAMTRTTPFVPIKNKYLLGQLKIKESLPNIVSTVRGKEVPPRTQFDILDESNRFYSSIPMAIMGIGMQMGADSAETIECRMTLLYWNPIPWLNMAGLTWGSGALNSLKSMYSRYITKKVKEKSVPSSFNEFTFDWWNIRSFAELLQKYELAQPNEKLEEKIEERASSHLPQTLPIQGEITSPYGERIHPETYERHIHNGIDIAAEIGTPVMATAYGKVSVAAADSRNGNYIRIKHANNIETRYAHLSSSDVIAGDTVYAGQIIGRSGNTGTSTGPHLHYSLLENGTHVDPMGRVSPGAIALNRFSKEIGSVKSAVTPATRLALSQEGWKQLARLPGGVPDPNITNPLFMHDTPNRIDFSPNELGDPETQVITSLSIGIQNKFAVLPLQGSPYPAIQHLGSSDSDIRMSLVCLSETEEFRTMSAAQDMLHIMDTRARKYRAIISNGREIQHLSQVKVSNRLLNAIGISNVTVTDISSARDQESPSLTRFEIAMAENGMNPEKETLSVQAGKSNFGFRKSLREEWLKNKQWTQSNDEELKTVAEFIYLLQKANDQAQTKNLNATANLNEEDLAKKATTMGEFKPDYGRRDGHYIEPDRKDYSYKMWSARMMRPTTRVFKKILEQVKATQGAHRSNPHPTMRQLVQASVSVRPHDIGEKDIFIKASEWIANIASASNDELNASYLRGEGQKFFRGPYGKDILIALRKMVEEGDTIGSAAKEYLRAWSNANHAWYNQHVIEEILLLLVKRFPRDESLRSLKKVHETVPNGCYEDLCLGDSPNLNPYQWLDAGVELDLKKSLRVLSEGTLNTIGDILKVYREDQEAPYRADKAQLNDYAKASILTSNENDSGQVLSEDGFRDWYATCRSSAISAAHSKTKGYGNIIENINMTPFLARRAFPAFKLYFIEEDNAESLVRRFDDFYAYNAIVDINIVKYKTRPSVMVLTMTNLFGHLDTMTYDDMVSKSELDAIKDQARTGNRTALGHSERDGVNIQVNADGTITPITDIMLKPGTKVMMRLGYDNNPDNLAIGFSGQVTEVSTGDVITVVCQDWTSELLTQARGDSFIPTPDWAPIQWFDETFGFYGAYDIQRIVTTKKTIGAILRNRNVKHFGHYQVGEWNPFTIGQSHAGSWLARGIKGQFPGADNAETEDTRFDSRAMNNVVPEPIPYYTVFGIDNKTAYLTKDEIYNRTLWEIIQLQALRHPNHVAMVKPFGEGDATLYFGPPTGTYIADHFTERDSVSSFGDDSIADTRFELFSDMIDNGETISINDYQGVLAGDPKVQGPISTNDIYLNGDTGFTTEVSIAEALTELVKNTPELWPVWGEGQTLGVPDKLYVEAGLEISYLLDSVEKLGKLAFNTFFDSELGELKPGNSPQTISAKRAYWSLINDFRSRAEVVVSPSHHALELISQTIEVRMRTRILQKAVNNVDAADGIGAVNEDAARIVDKIKPARRWHVITSRHHIISNNIIVNSNFANRVQSGDDYAQFDPNLDEVRTRYLDFEIPKSVQKNPVLRGLALNSLLGKEVAKMYAGELIITGIAEIEPHDIILIFDDVRRIHGAFEVAKIQHTFNQDMGFISIIEPNLIIEIGDVSLSAAIQAFYRRLGNDMVALKDKEKEVGELAPVEGAYGAFAAILYTPGPSGAGPAFDLISFVLTNLATKEDAKDHPISIIPLTKNGAPWITGLDGASGQGLVGVRHNKIEKGAILVRKMGEATVQLGQLFGEGLDSLTELPGSLEVEEELE